MLTRFSLYGFLKNQQYFEPFLILIFLEKGLSFTEIGLLIAFREVVVNLFEVVSGAVADVSGRRRSMITSFVSYIGSFLLFGLAEALPGLLAAMLLFGVGEAFRTGTHKAMIFAWLQSQGRESERTATYGRTRSWSKLGSALSVVIAAGFVLASDRLTPIFYLSIVPYIAGIVNFLGYPRELDGVGETVARGPGAVARHLAGSLRHSLRDRFLRRLLLESLSYEGLFRTAKDYLQPVVKAAAIPLVAALSLSDELGEHQRTALLVGPVFFALYLLSALTSRNAHRLVARLDSEDRAARWLWGLSLAVWALMLPAMVLGLNGPLILGFIVLYAFQNFFRPILISRIDVHCPAEQGATVLSIENQAKSLATMVLAPALGLAVDLVRQHELGGDFWPVAVVALALTLTFSLLPTPRPAAESACVEPEREERP